MASMVAENWEYVDGRDGSEGFEFSQINHNLLMSLLDETQIDDCDDEKLKKVIRSLEAEISSDGHYGFDNTMWESDLVDCQSSIDESTGQDDHSMQHDDLDLDHWMNVETMPTSPSDGMTSWYMDNHGQGMVGSGVNEFSWVHNYAPICSVTPFDQEQDYGSLWHETNVTV
ncbi:hypothetical protein PHJA_002719400 [Phtheirospermum japonicum]|uniref:Uncharacterized protein n=1 Tax=Phtheirospermum japonicum TaxID=374723 RepID=A0A830D566_9LAMI|nr:hypothetical protein PHJA_002719400 [Phtheirospermum japonicum]